MRGALLPLLSLLLSAAVLLVGHGLQLTLLPLRAEWLGWDAVDVGVTGAAYFAGFVLGCLTVPRIIARVGHIRAFAVLAATATAVLLLLSASAALPVWLALRAGTGWAVAGLYMVIESWLNESSPEGHRGAVVAIYTIVILVAMAGAQLLLPLGEIGEDRLFVLAAVFVCLSLVPVALTRHREPKPVPPAALDLKKLYRASSTGAVVALLGGMATGAYWSLGPLFARQRGFEPEAVGLFTMAVILGGAAAQYPLGRWSDRVDRRRVLAAVTGAGAVACVALALASVNEPVQLAGLGLVFGSVSLPIYALCVAHVNDNVADDEFVETASGVLMMNSIGSMVGPTVAAPAMSRWGPDALFAVAGVFLGAAFVWTLSRLRVDRQRAFFDPFFPLAQTSQSAIDLVAEASHEPDGGTGQARVPLAMAPVSVGRGIGGTREESVR